MLPLKFWNGYSKDSDNLELTNQDAVANKIKQALRCEVVNFHRVAVNEAGLASLNDIVCAWVQPLCSFHLFPMEFA